MKVLAHEMKKRSSLNLEIQIFVTEARNYLGLLGLLCGQKPSHAAGLSFDLGIFSGKYHRVLCMPVSNRYFSEKAYVTKNIFDAQRKKRYQCQEPSPLPRIWTTSFF